MPEQDIEWVDSYWALLDRSFSPRHEPTLFEPARAFYDLLRNGNDEQLQAAANQLASHVGLPGAPRTSYEFAMLLGRQSAGELCQLSLAERVIRIPLDYAGKPMVLGGILAHEVMHEVLLRRGWTQVPSEDVEPLTDLAAFFFGLGKLMLNGLIADRLPYVPAVTMLGYLPPELKVYAYKRFCHNCRVSGCGRVENLNTEALNLLGDN